MFYKQIQFSNNLLFLFNLQTQVPCFILYSIKKGYTFQES